jgi:hemoglobin
MPKARLMAMLGMMISFSALGLGCWSDGQEGERPVEKPKHPPKPLYERLGREKGIRKIVDDFAPRALANPRINFTRKGTPAEWKPTDESIAHIKEMMFLQIGEASGGPQRYTGRDMKSVHQGMRISGYEFDLLKRELKESLKHLKVKDEDQRDLFKIIESVRKDIVEVP